MNERESLAKRLEAARVRQGLEKPAAPQTGLPSGSWGLGLRAGVEVVSALIVGAGIGLLLDRWLGTWPWLFLLMFVLGSAAGVLNVHRLMNPRRGRGLDGQGESPGGG